MRPRRAALLALLTALLPTLAAADNCAYNRERMAQYLALCASHDGCASRAQMQRIVDETCGTQAGARAAPRSARPAPAAAPSPAAARKALATRPRSEAEADRQCRMLASYRDGAMARDFQLAVDRWGAAEEGRRHLQELREEVGGHFRTGTLLANGAVVLQFIKLKANLIGNLLSIDPATGTARQFAQRGWGRVLTALEKGDTIVTMLNKPEDLVTPMVTDVLRDGVPVIGPLLKTFADLTEDIQDVVDMRKDADAFYSEFDARTRYLDRELAKLSARAAKAQASFELINTLRAAIDARCSGRGTTTATSLP